MTKINNNMSKFISIHPLHDTSITFFDKNNNIRVFEYERFCKERYASITEHFAENRPEVQEFINYVKLNLKENPKVLLTTYNWYDYEELGGKFQNYILEQFNTIEENYIIGHHESHCTNAYRLSGLKNAIVFSMDGGGHDYYDDQYLGVCHYMIQLRTSKVNKILESSFDNQIYEIPGAYSTFGPFITEIYKPDKNSLSYAGKLMGLSAYGKIRYEWIPHIKKFYHVYYYDLWNKRYEMKKEFFENIGLSDHDNSFSGQNSYDLAATNQHVFEEEMFSLIIPYIEEYNLDVVLSGGCALNVVFNQKLAEYLSARGLKLFVSPNPGDEGLSLGSLLHYTGHTLNNEENIIPYCGIDVIDRDKINHYYKEYKLKNKVRYSSANAIVDLIKDGKIGGIIQGYSEVGPRALGNRSIICDPSISNMKDIINSKVKFREWFRPFAPVCREEDKNFYFEKSFPSPFMSFCPKVRGEYVEKLPSITHVDGTARLQTVTKNQHKLFYDILTELNNRNHIPVIMNTSFNIKGNPILTSLEDAFYVLENTELDFIVFENLLFESKGKTEHIYDQKQFGENLFSYPNLYSDVVSKSSSGSHFVEIGSWKGKSSAYMAVEIKNSGKDIKFDCIDPWFDQKEEGQYFEIEKNLYKTFLENIEPIKENINPIRSLSKDAVNLYENESLDFVFIDADYDYSHVYEDIKNWFPKVKRGGILAGNRINLDSVKMALENNNLKNYSETENCWIINKD